MTFLTSLNSNKLLKDDPSMIKSQSFSKTFMLPDMLKEHHSPTSPQSRTKSDRRHYRTATPEQRAIRAIMNNRPVYTMGIDPQSDRCLLYDFFEHIKQWAASYTIHIKSLNAEQVHNLAAHPAIAGSLSSPSQLKTLVTEKEMLIAMVASVITRHMWTYAMSENSLYASGHPQANICDALAYQWMLLDSDAYERKHDLLLCQQQVYTAIKNAPNYNSWRASCADRFTAKLLSDLDGLLALNFTPAALRERNHILSELYLKGYRIGFRLRMAPTKWLFQWPSSGTEFNPRIMVNESRMLYGDILQTMSVVMNNPQAHEVLFAVSPTVTRIDISSMEGEKRMVVHNAICHITRKRYT